MANPVNLSVVIITFNEERNIARCLDAVWGIADDLVVVDSFSTDKTELICKEKGARFVQHKFEGHIEQKNWAITQAKFPYVFSLDADEAPDVNLIAAIKAVKLDWTNDGYKMNRLTNYCGKWIRHCGWYPDTKLRLWDSTKGKWGGTNPHDKYELNGGDKNTGYLKGDNLHYSYYSVEGHRQQTEKFTTLAASDLFNKGERSNFIKKNIGPIIKFIKSYVFQLGILDGYYGFMICKISAHYVYLKYFKLQQLYKK